MALTAKREVFVQAIVAGMSQSDAYRSAFTVRPGTKPESVNQAASKLMSDPNLISRVEELRKPVIEKMQYGLEQAMQEASEAFVVSKAKENGGAMVAAVSLRAKLNGLLVERKEVKMTTIQELAEEDLDKLIAQKAREAGINLH